MLLKPLYKQVYIDINKSCAFKRFTDVCYEIIRGSIKNGYKSIVFVCIGTDRSTGDSLGPLIGYKIGDLNFKNVYIHGNLEEPVHAKNIDKVMDNILRNYENLL